MPTTENLLNEFINNLDAGWNEASATKDRVENTKAVLAQIIEAKKAVSKVIAVSARIGGELILQDASSLGDCLGGVLDFGCSGGGAVIALGLHLLPYLDQLQVACERGIANEEAIKNSGN